VLSRRDYDHRKSVKAHPAIPVVETHRQAEMAARRQQKASPPTYRLEHCVETVVTLCVGVLCASRQITNLTLGVGPS
jgi:hypothetical protein